MTHRKPVIFALGLFLLMLLPTAGIGQEFLNGICRIENGRLVFKIDLNWTADQIRDVSGRFDLDSTMLSKVLTGQVDSLMLADGWKWKKISNRTAELSKTLGQIPEHLPDVGKIMPFSRLFLIDDNWLNIPGLPDPEPAVFGVNRLSRDEWFSYSDSTAHFYLEGYPEARSVYLSGTFNDWSTMETPMKRDGAGWSVRIPLQPGKYAYKFIIDGRWKQDPNNKIKEDDLNGGFNSVVFCYNYRFTLDGYPNAKKVILAGSFNGFNPNALVMNHVETRWELPLYLKPGTHAYKFVVDGTWITDPANPVVRPDGRGNFNSFMGIGDTTWFHLKGFESAKVVILSGSFNGWNTAEQVMAKVAGGWQLPYVIAPGNYEYKFIADGRWMTDPANPWVNGWGDMANSFLAVNPNHTFVLDSFPQASRIAVSGSFNSWSHQGYSLARVNNRWILPLYLKPGKYTYKYIVDGKWILDPGNELWEENEYGTGNSVLWIER